MLILVNKVFGIGLSTETEVLSGQKRWVNLMLYISISLWLKSSGWQVAYSVLVVRLNERDGLFSLFLSIFVQAKLMMFLIWDLF